MYLDYFGFDEPPFSITPDPKFVFLSKKHEESLAHLVYGISRGGGAGFVQLTGEVGTGKTTISRLLLEQIPNKTNIALILNPTITPLELLQNICKELKISMRGIKTKLNTLVDKLNDYLLKSWADGENTVVIIDEAQNLPRDTLEQLRLLTNLETDKQKLLQIILIGQPELRATMRRDDLRQLAQRVTARYHLMPLDANETYDYLQHRIKIAGGKNSIITNSTAKKIHQLTGGVPRLINILSDRSLLAAYTDDSHALTIKHINTAAQEVLPESQKHSSFAIIPTIVTASVAVILSALLFHYLSTQNGNNAPIKPQQQAVHQVESTPKIQSQQQETPSLKLAPATMVWKTYFSLWDAKVEKNWHKAQCPSTSDTGMACIRRQGNLKQLLKLNHPIVLQLEDGNLALMSSYQNAKIGILNYQEKIALVDKQWLDEQWLGTYFIIWPMPAELLIEPTPKDLSNWALEMAQTLATEKITPLQLESWIKSFQNSHGLVADGIIGSETQMTLSLMAYNGPTLN